MDHNADEQYKKRLKVLRIQLSQQTQSDNGEKNNSIQNPQEKNGHIKTNDEQKHLFQPKNMGSENNNIEGRIPLKQLEIVLQNDKPFWSDEARRALAYKIINTLHQDLVDILNLYICEGKASDFSHQEFSIGEICALRKCGFIDALIMMDQYLKDPVIGRARILRR